MPDPLAGTEGEPRTAEAWKQAIERAEKSEADWIRRTEKIIKLYRRQSNTVTNETRKFAMLWANIETLKPAIYARLPKPAVARRFKDRDPIGREASEILERCLETAEDQPPQDDDAIYKQVRDDRLLGGRGVARIRYEARIDGEQISDERSPLDHIHWRDFKHGPGRTWEEVPWVAFRAWLTKEAWERRFVSEEGKPSAPHFIPAKPPQDSADDKPQVDKAPLWEIWDRVGGYVCWVSPSHDNELERSPPHLKFDGFFPCPRPLYATLANENLIPTPDYVYYQDQAEEIDDLTARIARLQDSLKLVGFYPGGSENAGQIERALEPGFENKMVAIDSWAAFAEKGGAAAIVWLPIADVIAVLQGCVEVRRQLIEDVYQISGISDIVRGQTDPNETLGAQELKGQYSSARVTGAQDDMARFCRDVQRLRAEVIAENFQPQTIAEMSGKVEQLKMAMMPQMPALAGGAGLPGGPLAGMVPGGRPDGGMGPPQSPAGPQPATQPNATGQRVSVDFLAAIKLLRDQKLRGFAIEVETDSTIAPDEAREKAEWAEMLTAVSGFMQQAIPLVQSAPAMLPVVGELLVQTVRKFRCGRSVEDVIEQAMTQLEQAAAQPQGPPPEVQAAQAKAEAEMQIIQAKAAADQQAMALKAQQGQAEHEMRLKEMQADLLLKQAELALEVERLKIKDAELQMQAAANRDKHELNLEAMQAKAKLAKQGKGNGASKQG